MLIEREIYSWQRCWAYVFRYGIDPYIAYVFKVEFGIEFEQK